MNRIPSVRDRVNGFRSALICLLAGMLLVACQPKAVIQGPPDSSTQLNHSVAEKPSALKDAERPINAPKVDHNLLIAAIFQETNMRRRENGLAPLRHEPRLDAAARQHAASMAQHNYLSHTDPYNAKYRAPKERALEAGFQFRFLAENIATHFAIQYQSGTPVYQVPAGTGYSYQPNGSPILKHTYQSFAATLLDQWMNSPGHRQNILSVEPDLFGSDCRLRSEQDGLDKFYCVQLFGRALE
ncbi:MAG: CAP domain-containing protein [Desulfobacteraceae bacterium]|nr:CAP domain-containing protein [Desulfobacteraceae bacterium]